MCKTPDGDANVQLVGVEDVAPLWRPAAVAESCRPLADFTDPVWVVDIPYLHDSHVVARAKNVLAVARPFDARYRVEVCENLVDR